MSNSSSPIPASNTSIESAATTKEPPGDVVQTPALQEVDMTEQVHNTSSPIHEDIQLSYVEPTYDGEQHSISNIGGYSGGGSRKKWSSQLIQICVWRGGLKVM